MSSNLREIGSIKVATSLEWVTLAPGNEKRYAKSIGSYLSDFGSVSPSHVTALPLVEGGQGSVGFAFVNESFKTAYSLAALFDLYAKSLHITTWQAQIWFDSEHVWYASAHNGIVMPSSDVEVSPDQLKSLSDEDSRVVKSPTVIFVNEELIDIVRESGGDTHALGETVRPIDLEFIISSLSKKDLSRARLVNPRQASNGNRKTIILSVLVLLAVAYQGAQWWQNRQAEIAHQEMLRQLSAMQQMRTVPGVENLQIVRPWVNAPYAEAFIDACDHSWQVEWNSIPGWDVKSSLCDQAGLHVTWALSMSDPQNFVVLPSLLKNAIVSDDGNTAKLDISSSIAPADRSQEHPLVKSDAVILLKAMAGNIGANITLTPVISTPPPPGGKQINNPPSPFMPLGFVVKAPGPASFVAHALASVPTLIITQYDPSNPQTDMEGTVYVQ